MFLGPAEAALRLKVSERRVRALLEEGRIPGQRVNGRWVIDESDVRRYRSRGPAGRPLSERSAWQLALYAGNDTVGRLPPPDLSPVEKHRLKQRVQRLRESPNPADLIRSLLANRAQKAEFSSSAADLPGLREDPRLRLSGVSHPLSGLLPSSELEAYVSRQDFDAMVEDWFLVEVAAGQRSNVLLHVAESLPDELPSLVIAADLAERPGIREQQSAEAIIRGLMDC